MNGQSLNFPDLTLIFQPELRSNLVRLPPKVCQLLDKSNIPIQEFGLSINSDLLVGWDGQVSNKFQGNEDVIEINPVLASEYGLQMTQFVDISVKHYDSSYYLTEVHGEPETIEDWEFIDANAAFFQDQILYQTRIVKEGSKLICYMSNKVCKISITGLIPRTLKDGRLTNDTLVIVAPKQKQPSNQLRDLICGNGDYHVKRTVYDQTLPGLSITLDRTEYHNALVEVVKNPLEKENDDDLTSFAQKICVKAISDPSLGDKEVKISRQLREALNLQTQNGYKLKIVFVTLPELKSTIKIHPFSSSVLELEEYITCIKKSSVVTNNLLLRDKEAFVLTLTDEKNESLPFLEITGNEDYVLGDPLNTVIPELDDLKVPEKMVGITELYENIFSSLSSPITMSNAFLLTGNSGMGKTLVLKNLEYDLLMKQGLYVNYINCDSIQDTNNLAKMKQRISEICHIAYWNSPSVILLDNAESIFPTAKSSEEQPGNNQLNQNSTKIAQMLINEVEQINNNNSGVLKIVLAVKSKESLNALFSLKQFIGNMWSLKPPTRYQRDDLLEEFFNRTNIKLSPGLRISDVSLETEGYSPSDLLMIVDKFFYDLIGKGDSLILSQKILDSCIADFSPSSLRGVKLQKSTGVKWSDIGGLSVAKTLLLETLEWPVKYGPIFSNCPLRLRSGILLYGYPGCGKTMLASAVAQQCGLNFISVKGPEILNKYIGASEQSVRDLFDRAQAAKPCILFFDEFDSIAPKRGHDSTGVTDRVVNQMLTQMDGAEGLDGVYVLAATSRPDLIDSALLRPGRLDKSVLCDIPETDERLEILKTVTAKMALDPTCDLNEIALRTAGFSGADLQGMSYNAYLKAVHRSLDMVSAVNDDHITTENGLDYLVVGEKPVSKETIDHLMELMESNLLDFSAKEKKRSAPVSISTQDMITACSEAKPSISKQELLKYKNIYTKFIGDRDGQMPSGEASQEIGGRTTLA